ncbi:retrovirus-related pol polyprotein from transposon TNT 1-94 [Tanacetum coccineum]
MPSLKDKKVNIAPVDYVALNILFDHFVKHFVPQKQLSVEQAFWLPISKPVSKAPPVPLEPVLKKEIPREISPINLHGLHKELKDMQAIFNQMETEVAKHSVDKKCFKIEKKELIIETQRLLEHIICQYVMNVLKHVDVLPKNDNCLEHDNFTNELLKLKNDRLMALLISQDLVHTAVNALAEFFIINDLQAKLKAKNVSIENLKKHIANLKGKNVVKGAESVNKSNVFTSNVYKLDLRPLSPRIKNNREAHVDYLKVTQEHIDTLRDIVEQARALKPLDNALDYACNYTQRIQELLVCVCASCPSSKHVRVTCSTEASESQPSSNTKKNRISRTSSSNKKNNKVEDQPRIVTSSLNNMNRVSNTSCNANVKHSMLNANSKLIYATCNKCMFDAIHDLCVRVSLNNVNARAKSKYVKSAKRNVTISRVYYVEGIGHNLFSVGQFCDSDLEVAFQKHTCFVRNLEGKSKKYYHKPKAEDTNQEKLYLLLMDLCEPMRVESINGKKYILVIVDDYSRFTWVKFLRSKDEAPEVIIKCLKQIQVRLNATIQNVRTDNGTEFVNQTLKDYYENVGISHQTSVARTP